jgi:hypothetical protein
LTVRVAIGIAHYSNGKALFWQCLEAMRTYSHSQRIRTEKISFQCCYIEHSRNVITSRARAQGFDYLLFLDDDMTFPKDLLVRLLSHKKDIAVANYYRKQWPHVPVVSVVNEGRLMPVFVQPEGAGVHRVNCAGTGICLIRMDVFSKVPFPWFFNEYSEPMPGDTTDLVEGMVLIGEDTRFFMLTHQHGVEVWCDFSILAGHIGEKEFSHIDFIKADAQIGGSGPMCAENGLKSERHPYSGKQELPATALQAAPPIDPEGGR